MGFSIRPYQDSDRSELIRFMEELQDYMVSIDSMHLRRRLPAYGETYANYLLQEIQEHQGLILIAEVQNIAVGVIAGIIENQMEDDLLEWIPHTTGRVLELYISDHHRAQGIGKMLMQKMETYFLEKNCDVVRIEVLSANRRAYDFYRKSGYNDRFVDVIKFL